MTYRNSNNIFVLDLIRVLCIIWIVVFWHGNDYMPIEYQFNESRVCLDYITTMVLGVFSLLSGLLLSKYRFNSFSEIMNFYKKRFSRFFVLFFIAVMLFYLLGFYTLKTSLKCILGVSVYIGQKPYTLWYMSMLMTFYILSPLVNCTQRYLRFFMSLVFVSFMIFLHYICNLDYKVLGYFVCYITGLYSGGYIIKWLRNCSISTHVVCRIFVETLAYASFCMYLFHRVFFYLVGKVYGYADQSICFSMPFRSNVVAIITTIILSYFIQLAYDKLLNFLQQKTRIV